MKKSVTVILLFAAIALILVFSGSRGFTTLQVLDLPAPPSPPGMEQDQQVQQQPDVPECGNQVVESGEECEFNLDCGIDEECVACICVPIATTQAADILSDIDIPEGEELPDIIARLDTIEDMLLALDLLPAFENRLNQLESQVAMAGASGQRLDALESRVKALEVEVANLRKGPQLQAPLEALAKVSADTRRNIVLSITLSILSLLIIIGLVGAAVVERRHDKTENKRLIRQYLLNYQKAGYSLSTLRMHLRACGWKDKMIEEAIKELPK